MHSATRPAQCHCHCGGQHDPYYRRPSRVGEGLAATHRNPMGTADTSAVSAKASHQCASCRAPWHSTLASAARTWCSGSGPNLRPAPCEAHAGRARLDQRHPLLRAALTGHAPGALVTHTRVQNIDPRPSRHRSPSMRTAKHAERRAAERRVRLRRGGAHEDGPISVASGSYGTWDRGHEWARTRNSRFW